MKAHMICHTHWDREWYFTREEFRTKLVRLIDGLLDVIDEIPEYVSFMLDGQTIAIEDYLEIKPYQREKLYKALRNGKIICGPWYVLPDELLISGESHIRNYLIGSKVLSGTGNKMKIAYLPDSFGHPAQMPQIVRGLGMETMVFWRGTADFMEHTEFNWESPAEGIACLSIHMPCGYGNCGNLSGDNEQIYQRVRAMVETLKERSTTDQVLLMNGSDHITGQKDITEIVKEINRRAEGSFQVQLSTLESFVGALRERLGALDVYQGEFRYAHRSMLLGGTLSTRMYLKQKNNQVQKAQEQYLEPLMALELQLGGGEDTTGYREYLWKKILENHPHDSICGCSIDEVHKEMETRFACVEQLQKILFGDMMKRLEKQFLAEQDQTGVQMLFFQASQDKLPGYARITVDMDRVLLQEVDFAKSIIVDYEDRICHPMLPCQVEVTDEEGRRIPCRILKVEKADTTLYQDHTLPEVYRTNRLLLEVLLPGYSYGLHTLRITCRERGELLETLPEVCEMAVENEFYKITCENAAFTVFDKKTGKSHTGVGRLVDMGDAGDEYTYSWPKQDSICSLKEENIEISVEESGIRNSIRMQGSLMLPKHYRKTGVREVWNTLPVK